MSRLQVIIVIASLALSCVDPVDISLPATELPLILEGHVTDNPAPDTIRLTRAYPADGTGHLRVGVERAKMWITDDTGAVDTLIDLSNGIYVTDNLQGQVGRTYTLEGRYPSDSSEVTFASTPERMLPAGTIDSVYYELTTTVNPETGVSENGLNVFIDATVDASSRRRMRWKFNGTYLFMSDPAAIMIPQPCPNAPGICGYLTLPCADGCLCCMCWASEREALPLVTNPAFLGGTEVKRVFVKSIPINGFTFFEKYRVEVTQMELSEPVFDFYLGIRKQMENASSLFQPPFFELEGNVTVASGKKIIGIFSAAAEVKTVKYIHKAEFPFHVFASVLPGDCRVIIDHSTNVEPPFWN